MDNYDDAACRGLPTEKWFSFIKADITYAKDICVDCPVRQVCYDGAIRRGETAGIWGGVIFENGAPGIKRLPGRPPAPIAHGTASGYAKERQRNLTPCQACTEANAKAKAERRALAKERRYADDTTACAS